MIFASAVTANGGTIISITGSSPFGFAGTVLVQGWNQTTGYAGVDITMPLESLGSLSGVQGTVYLMNQVGPGTTSANEVAAPVLVMGLTNSFEPVLLFSGLTLGAGNYYIVLVPTTADSSLTSEGTSFPTDIFGSGITDLGSGQTGAAAAAFPPATSVSTSLPSNFFITVTGNASAVPEPTAFSLTVAGIGALALWRRRFRA